MISPGDEGLPDLVDDHIIRPPLSAGPGLILPLREKKLRIGNPAVTLEAGDQFTVVGLLWILHIVDDVTDGPAHSPALAGVQRDEAGGGDRKHLLLRTIE